MSAYNKYIQEFLQTTCKQIRFKTVHKSVINELSDHIEEQKCEYIKQGLDEEVATVKALEQMGDPVLVGKQLDKAHRPRTEWSILSLAAILVVIGGAVQFFLSRASTNNSDLFTNFLIYSPIGIVAFVVTYFFDYTLIGRYSKLVYCMLFITTIAGFLVLRPINGTYRHVYYAALLFIPVYAGVIYGFRNKGYMGIIACGLFYGGPAVLCIIAPRLTGLILFSIASLAILTIAISKGFFKCNKRVSIAIVYIPTAITVIIPILYIFSVQYRRARLSVMINPELDHLGEGYQHFLVKRLLEASRPFGKAVLDGSFTNIRIEQFLPGWETDLSLTYIIARLGYVAGGVITLIILILIVRMFLSVVKQKNLFGSLLSCSACIAITGQFILHVLSNIGVIAPMSGILPFISFGGMGFVTNMILVGIVLSVYRRSNIVIGKQQNSSHDKRLFSFEAGKLIIDFGSKFSKNSD